MDVKKHFLGKDGKAPRLPLPGATAARKSIPDVDIVEDSSQQGADENSAENLDVPCQWNGFVWTWGVDGCWINGDTNNPY